MVNLPHLSTTSNCRAFCSSQALVAQCSRINCGTKSCILQTCLTSHHFVDLILGLSHMFAFYGSTLVGIVVTSNI
jgi:hypothetical protein